MERNIKLDLFKGVAISLVLIGHSIQGACTIENSDCFENIFFKTIYSFHMPLFMLISGYLFYYSHEKAKSTLPILKKRILSFLPPILTLSTIIAIMSLIFGKSTTPYDIACNFIKDVFLWRFWFLWSIILNVAIIGFIFSFCKHPILVIIATIPLTMLIPDNIILAEHKFVYPYFIIGYITNMAKTANLFSTNKFILLASTIIYIMLLENYDKSCYIYTSGFCVIRDNWRQQIFIDGYRFMIDIGGAYIISRFLNKITSVTFIRFFANLGKRTFGVYVLQMFAMNYINYIPNFSASTFILFVICFIYLASFSIMVTYISERNKLLRRLILGKWK